jgi:chromosome segregation ATPase
VETDTENVKLAEENIRLNNDLERATTKVEELTANNAYLKQGMADMQNKQDRIPLPQKNIRDLEQQIVRTIDTLNKSRIHQKEMEKEIKKLSAGNLRLQTELATATELVEELIADKAHLEDQITESKDTDQKRYDEYIAELQRNECSRLEGVFEAATKSLEKVRADNAYLKEELAASQSTKNHTWFSDYAADMLDTMKQFESRLGKILVSREAAYARADELTHENLELKKDLAFALDKHTNQSASNNGVTATEPSDAHGTTTSKIDTIEEAWIVEEDQEHYADSDSWSLGEATPASSSGNSF